MPGPKMVWQFGELGYDFAINRCPDGTNSNDCRTANKPIRWDYRDVQERRKLYNVYASLIALKKNEPVFETTNFTQNVVGAVKTIHLQDDNLKVTVVGNFDIVPQVVNPQFQQTGTWYNYLTGATLSVTNPTANLTLQPGEYAVYTSRLINRPTNVLAARGPRNTTALRLTAAPNPAATTATLSYELTTAAPVTVSITNLMGATVRTLPTTSRQAIGAHELPLSLKGLANGVYLVRVSTGNQIQTTRLVVQH
ncbi:T9SS type A sorting domain-containing protein [Hymenobacter sp. HDW8]|uniref:T9SS type A sorting domain-containing protein n=1 Tax=Hymenobacter sp. HDW8 TaxID=2714932 RepID=UPI00196A9E13|nr:T9SS type A sorting domain-containing protein [Hymenobacter sp. HDW8]